MFYDEKPQYKELLPNVFQPLIEINVLDNTVKIQLDKLNTLTRDSINNKSVQNANEQGVARWEKLLGVTSPLGSTLQSRREAVKSKLMTKPPINLITLKNIIETYMGVIVDITIKDFIVTVKYRGVSKIADLNPLYATAYETIPANLILNIVYAFVTYTEESARFATYNDQTGYTYDQIMKGEF